LPLVIRASRQPHQHTCFDIPGMQDHFEHRLVPPDSDEAEIAQREHGSVVIRVRIAKYSEKFTTALTYPIAGWR
jgi:hypothetical protein